MMSRKFYSTTLDVVAERVLARQLRRGDRVLLIDASADGVPDEKCLPMTVQRVSRVGDVLRLKTEHDPTLHEWPSETIAWRVVS